MNNLSKSKIFLLCLLSFVFGIFIASQISEKILSYHLYYFSSSIFFIIILILYWHNKKIRLIALLAIFLFIGVWRFSISLPENLQNKIWYYNGTKSKIVGIIKREPEVRENLQKIILESEKIEICNKNNCINNNISGKILITLNLYPEITYGDRLELMCNLKKVEPINDFAYDKYLSRFDIYSVCYFPELKIVGKKEGNIIFSKILILKNIFREKISRGINAPEADLAKAIMLGDSKTLGNDIQNNFSKSGLSHLIAISGLNITIFASILSYIFLSLGISRKVSFYLSSIFLLFYIFLIGAPASAMRAGLMGFLLLWAIYIGRLNRMVNAVILAASVMLLINPKLLIYDVGFQLSFLAIISIIYLYPIIDKFFEIIKISKIIGLRDSLSLTISAQIITMPIIIYNFSFISFISPLANILVVWTSAILMISIILALAASFIFPFISYLFFLPSYLILKYIIYISKVCANFKFSYITVGKLGDIWIYSYYFIIFIVFYYLNWKKNLQIKV